MPRFLSRFVLVGAVAFALACAGTPTIEEAHIDDGECCDADDVIHLQLIGVSDDGMIAAIESDTLEYEVADDDVVKLQAAQVAQPVIDALVGAPEPEPPPVQTRNRVAAPRIPPLDVSVGYRIGAGKITLNNHSGIKYTSLVITANGEYVYRLKRLPVGAADGIRVGSFRSRNTGRDLTAKIGVKSLHIRADQGTWTKSY